MSDQRVLSAAPWHFWGVGGLLLIWNGLAAFDYIATLVRFEPYLAGHPENVLDYFYNAPTWMYVVWGGSMLGGFVSSVFLLLRRKIAASIAAVAWMFSVVAVIYTTINPPPIGGGIVFSILVLILALLVIFYMIWLSRRGVLR